MKRIKKARIVQITLIIGILLVTCAVMLLVSSELIQKKSIRENKKIVQELYSLMPEVTKGYLDDRIDITMPLLEIRGENFAGIIEIPKYNRTLPVHGTWNKSKTKKFPCVFSGSIYDNSLIIGGSDTTGHFDFMKTISEGDMVFVTDTTGSRFSYTIDKIEITKDISRTNLTKGDYNLVLFARNTRSLDYTIIRLV